MKSQCETGRMTHSRKGASEARNEREEKEGGEIVDFSRREASSLPHSNAYQPRKPFGAQVRSSRKRARVSWPVRPAKRPGGIRMPGVDILPNMASAA